MERQGRLERNKFFGEKRKSGNGSQKRSRVTEIQKGQEFDVKIEELGKQGDGMVKIDSYTVFIRNVEIGNEVKIKIKKVLDTVAFADRLN